jgi:hypothetical protein
MSCITTHASNKDKHPGIVDVSPTRCAPVCKKVDNQESAEEKQAREEAHRAGICHIAKVEECNAEKLKALMASGPKPWPQMVTTVVKTGFHQCRHR